MSLDLLFANPSGPLMIFLKIGLLILIFMYLIFMLIAIKQIHTMNEIITQHDLFPIINRTAFAMLFVGVALFVLTLVIL